jgi:hypothetical protein
MQLFTVHFLCISQHKRQSLSLATIGPQHDHRIAEIVIYLIISAIKDKAVITCIEPTTTIAP